MDGQRSAGIHAEIMPLRIGVGADEDEEIRDALAEDLRTFLLHASVRTQEEIA